MEFTSLLELMVEKQASDLFLTVGAPPHIKVEGVTTPINAKKLDPDSIHSLIYSMMEDRELVIFEKTFELNKAISIPRLGRFRINIYRQRSNPAAVIRYIKDKIPSVSELGLPDKLHELSLEERGLVLVVGGTGTGKSTTLASMIDYRSQQRSGHILTIEDPIEYTFSHKSSLVDQREVGIDTLNYDNALANAMREAPDVIMMGEIRTADAMKHAISFSETGHLCMSTLHANNANQALDRILAFFTEAAQRQVLMDLALHLKAIISQRLATGVTGKRVPAVELMIVTPYISELIMKGKIDQIREAMQQTKGRIHQTFDEDLYRLWREHKIDEDEAMRLADSHNNLSLKIRLDQDHLETDYHRLRKEVLMNKKAPFSNYHSFSISAIKVDSRLSKQMASCLERAITYSMLQKGYHENKQKPDIEIQLHADLQSSEPDICSTIEDSKNLRDSEQVTDLVINIFDCASKEKVWRLHACRLFNCNVNPQTETNRELIMLLHDFPDHTPHSKS